MTKSNVANLFAVGDNVKVTDIGHAYSHYDVMAKKMCLQNFKKGSTLANNLFGFVKAIESDPDTGTLLYGINVGGQDFIISGQGLEIVERPYKITLTEDEARTLFVLVGSVLGDCEDSPRKHTSTVYSKFYNMLPYNSWEAQEYALFGVATEYGKPYIRFANYTTQEKTPQQLKIEELEQSIANAQKQLEELKGLK